jgi:hypothetical protein
MHCQNCGVELEGINETYCRICEEEERLKNPSYRLSEEEDALPNTEETKHMDGVSERERIFLDDLIVEEEVMEANISKEAEEQESIEKIQSLEEKKEDIGFEEEGGITSKRDRLWQLEELNQNRGFAEIIKDKLSVQRKEENVFDRDPMMKSEKRKKMGQKILLAVIGLFLLFFILRVTGVIEGASSPRKRYLSAEQKTFVRTFKGVSDFLSKQKQEHLLFEKNPYELNAQTNIAIKGYYPPEFTLLLNLLNEMEISKETIGDHVNQKYSNAFSFRRANKEAIVFELYQSKRQFDFYFPESEEAFYRVELDDVKDLANKYGVLAKYLPERWSTLSEYIHQFDTIRSGKIQGILKKYASEYLGSVKKNNVVWDKSFTEKIPGTDREYRKFIVRLHKSEVERMFGRIFEKLKKDRQVYDLVKQISSAVFYQNPTYLRNWNQNFTMGNYEALLSKANAYLQKNDFYTDVEMNVYVDAQNQVVVRRMEFYDKFDNRNIKNTLLIQNHDHPQGYDFDLELRMGEIQSELLFKMSEEDLGYEKMAKEYVFQMNYVDGVEVIIPFWPLEVHFKSVEDRKTKDREKQSNLKVTLALGRNDYTEYLWDSKSKLRVSKDISVPIKNQENRIHLNQDRADKVLTQLLPLLKKIVQKL